MTEEEYKIVEANLDEIESIIRSKSMFHCSMKLKEQIFPIADIKCKACSGNIWSGIQRLYTAFIRMRNEKNTVNPSPKKNKRKSQDSL